jgi:ArsR family metal-binding transcriptional regulator
MAKVDGEEDAIAQLAWFQDLVNDVWRQREQLTPCYEPRKRLGPLDVYPLLPRLNCKGCGEATCMAFAFALLLGGRELSECPHLSEPAHADAGQRLRELLGAENALGR